MRRRMKIPILVICLFMFGSLSTVQAQSRVKERNLRGTWKLEIELDKDADTAMGRIVENAVDGLLDEIDIYMDFRKNNELVVTVNAFGEKEVEYSEWYINDAGELHIGDSDHFQTDRFTNIIIFSIQEHDHIGILLDRARFTQIR